MTMPPPKHEDLMIDVTRRYERLLLFLLYPLLPFLLLRARLGRRDFGDSPRILIVTNLTRIGDIIAATPVFRAIKERYPKSRLEVLVSVKAVGILAANARIDRLIAIEHYKKNFLDLIREIYHSRFDIGISLSGTALSSLLFMFGGISLRLKLCRTPRPFNETLTDWTATKQFWFPHNISVTAFFLSMLNELGVTPPRSLKEVEVTVEGEHKANIFLEKNNLSNQRLIGISVSPSNKVKEWGIERFAKLIELIVTKYPLRFVVIGSPADNYYIENLRKLTDVPFVTATDFSLSELPSLVKRLSFFVSGNTGPMHIADALDIPMVVINGPVDDKELIPEQAPHILVKPRGNISPTIFAFKPAGDPRLSQKALEETSVEDVFVAFEKLWGMAEHLKEH